MEPEGSEDPGPGALTVGMSADRIRAEIDAALAELGPVDGINNHMGSLATADIATMRAVLAAAQARGLAFIDSRTTPASVVESQAAIIGVPVASRDVFLDNEADAGAIRMRLEELKRLARAHGQALAIGHVQTPGLAALLMEALPQLVREGYVLVGAQELARVPRRGGGQ
jgi:hypothetical protein